MAAMPEEIGGVVALLDQSVETIHGRRSYYEGFLNGTKVVVVFSRWGKVAAAATVSTLIHQFKITELVFTGVAGAISNALSIGDIVIGRQLVQHDMDARPLMPQFEIPMLQKAFFQATPILVEAATKAADHLLHSSQLQQVTSLETLAAFNINVPALHVGDIASGDQFFSGHQQKEQLARALPSVLCVEMEGAAVAQVCYENEIPFVVIRTISDAADEGSPVDFTAFIKNIASHYSVALINNLFAAGW